MLSVPTFMFYAATVLMIIVCSALTILIFYLIGAARAALRVVNAIEEGGRRAGRIVRNVERTFKLVFALFDFKD